MSIRMIWKKTLYSSQQKRLELQGANMFGELKFQVMLLKVERVDFSVHFIACNHPNVQIFIFIIFNVTGCHFEF